MSLSNPRGTNPTKKFIEWSGSTGNFKYYDKEQCVNVQIKEPLYIVPLDVFSTIKGYHDASNSGIYSNEVRFLSKDVLAVRSFKGGEIAKGLYSEIKGKLEGGKFSKSLYAANIIPKGKGQLPEIELVNVCFTGSALGVFIDAKINVDSGEIIVLSPSIEEKKKGNTKYFEPVIKKDKKRLDILEMCIQLDVELQEYMKIHLASSESEAVETKEVKPIQIANHNNLEQSDLNYESEDENSDLPF